MNEKIPPPIDSGNDTVNIHLSYIRRDLDDLKNIQKSQHAENIAKLDSLQNTFVTTVTFEEHLKVVQDHEERLRTNAEELGALKEEQSNIRTMIKTWGGIGGLLLGGLQIFQILYAFSHKV